MSLFTELKRRKVVRVAVSYSIAAFVILQVAQLFAEGLDLPGWVFRSITLLVLVGFPVALVLAWALELTPEGVKRTEPAEPGTAPEDRKRLTWTTVVPGVLAIALIGFAGWWYLSPSPTTYDSIAVLPFVNLSPHSKDDYLGDGLAEELLNALGNVPALKVAARTSAFSFKGRDTDVRTIAGQLGVVTVLEGSVRKSGDRVRVAAQLIDANSGFVIWRGDYDRSTFDLFALQNEIATEIVSALAVELGAGTTGLLSMGGTENGEAYELYIRARQRWATRAMPELRTALEEMRSATRLDPDFALAWSGLSDVINALAWRSPEFVPLEPEGKAAALRSLALNPALPEAWASMGIILAEFDNTWDTGEMFISHAVTLRPSYAQAHQWLADIQRYIGRYDQMFASFDHGARLDPLSNFFKQNRAIQLIRLGDAARGEQLLREVLAEWPEHTNSLYFLAFRPEVSLGQAERLELAERWAAAAGCSEPARARIFVQAIYDPQFKKAALAVLEDFMRECSSAERQISAWAAVAALLGDKEHTLDILERGSARLEGDLLGIGTDSVYAFIADDPRFRALLAKSNLPLVIPGRESDNG